MQESMCLQSSYAFEKMKAVVGCSRGPNGLWDIHFFGEGYYFDIFYMYIFSLMFEDWTGLLRLSIEKCRFSNLFDMVMRKVILILMQRKYLVGPGSKLLPKVDRAMKRFEHS